MAVKSCTACGNEELEEGFLLDSGQGSNYGKWVRGRLETGLLGGAKLMGRDRIDIQAYRCTRCNHLELYAENLFY